MSTGNPVPVPAAPSINWLQIAQIALNLALTAAQAEGAPAAVIDAIETGVDATLAGITAIKQAQTNVDPNALQDIPPIQ